MMIEKRIFLFVLVFFLICLGSVFSFEAYAESKGFLVSQQLLKHADLEFNWQINLPIKKNEKVDRLVVLDQYLYILTDQNYFFCVDREKGKVRFELQLTVAGLPACGPVYFNKQLYFVIGNELVVLDPSAGTIAEPQKLEALGSGSVCGFDRNSSFLYVLGTDNRLRVLVVDEYWQKFAVTADNDSLINSIIADEKFLFFSTKEGNVVKVAADGPEKKWQFDIPGKVNAPIVRDGQWLYVGSENTKIYKLDIENGNKGWVSDFVTGEKLTSPVVAGKEVIYQNAGAKGLYAINKETGSQAWHVPDGLGLIAEKDSKAFILAKPGLLIVMDNTKGTELHSVNFATVSRFATNTTDSKMYVSDDIGRLACIQAKE